MLITFVLAGKCLEATARGKASEAMTRLLRLQPPTALVCDDPSRILKQAATARTEAEAPVGGAGEARGASCSAMPHASRALEAAEEVASAVGVHEVDVSTLAKRDVIKVLPGSQVPLDGVVLLGCSSVDEAMLTGEAMPVPKAAGDRVVGGTINQSGLLWVQVTAASADSVLAQIAAVVAAPSVVPERRERERRPSRHEEGFKDRDAERARRTRAKTVGQSGRLTLNWTLAPTLTLAITLSSVYSAPWS